MLGGQHAADVSQQLQSQHEAPAAAVVPALHTLGGWKLRPRPRRLQPRLSWPPRGSLLLAEKRRPEAALILMTVAPIVEAGRRAKPMAMACAQDPKGRANIEALGTLGSRFQESTPGPGRPANCDINGLVCYDCVVNAAMGLTMGLCHCCSYQRMLVLLCFYLMYPVSIKDTNRKIRTTFFIEYCD